MTEVVDDFAKLARRYCDLIEDHEDRDRASFVAESRRLLLALYSAALDLPALGYGTDPSTIPEGAEMSTEEWMELFRSLGSYLGSWDAYAEVFDPYNAEDTPVVGSLSDDLADVYRDLRRGLALFDASDRPGKIEAVWDWRFHFHSHWGEHATGALRPMHRLLELAFLEE